MLKEIKKLQISLLNTNCDNYMIIFIKYIVTITQFYGIALYYANIFIKY